MDWLKVIGLALVIGVPVGMLVMGFIVGATRCDGCCRSSPDSPSPPEKN